MNRKAFTIIEVIAVVAILSLITVLGVPQLQRIFRTNLRGASAEISSIIRYTYDSSVMKGRIHRMVFDIDNKKYYMEISTDNKLIEERIEKEENEEKDEQEKTNFIKLGGHIGGEKFLPSDIFFDSIEKIKNNLIFKEGIVYLYFFPHGMTEDVIIRLRGRTESMGFYSLRVNQVTGRTRIEGSYIEKE